MPAAPVVVAVDAAPLLGARTGMGVVTAGLVGAMAGRGDVVLRGYGLTATGWGELRRLLPPPPAGIGAGRAPMPAGVLARVWAFASLPPVEWWTGPVDVVHGTNFVVPPSRRAARLVTVADLTPWRYPELATAASRRYPGLVARAVWEGATVHTFATSVAAELAAELRLDPARVVVVPPGVDPHPPPAVVEPGPPYVLALGTVEPRKDLPGLVAAFDAVAGSHPDLQLRIAGPDGWGAGALDAAIAGAAHRARIHRVGWVADPSSLLAGATVLAFPSRYEGFGLPPLEAMARGVPVVCTDAGALPEVVGPAAVVVPVGDGDALAGALDRVVGDEGLRREMVAAGATRVAGFGWARAAEGYARMYAEVSGGRF